MNEKQNHEHCYIILGYTDVQFPLNRAHEKLSARAHSPLLVCKHPRIAYCVPDVDFIRLESHDCCWYLFIDYEIYQPNQLISWPFKCINVQPEKFWFDILWSVFLL